MKRFVTLLPYLQDRRFFQNRTGATAIEYGLIAGLIVLAVVGAATTIGSSTGAAFQNVSRQGWGN